MDKDVFNQLREQLDKYAFGYPVTESGVEMELLKLMFTEEEARMFTRLTAVIETPDSVAERIGEPVRQVAAHLEDMARKGLLFRQRKGDMVGYSTIPFIHGLYEFQIERLGKKLVKLCGKYINEVYKYNMAQGTRAFIRTIPIEASVETEYHVATHEDAREILREQELIVVTKCACRLGKSLFEMDCGKPLEVCFMFGPMGQYYIDNGMGRQVDLQEALSILEVAHEAGLIVQPASSKRPFDLCNCCVDCCGFLRAISKLDNPADIVFSNYQIVVDRHRCVGCGVCEKRCGMGAVTMNPEDGLADFNPLRCIGCGLCVSTCEVGARRLVPKSGKSLVPSDDTPEMFKKIAESRGIKEIEDADWITFGFERARQSRRNSDAT